jgi:CubicO group peptidase (beta-lactamase class C family)
MSSSELDRAEQNLLVTGEPKGGTIRERMSFHNARTVSLAVIDAYEIVAARMYSDVEDTTIETSTLFQAASISKPVASLAVLKLVEQEKLSLDAPVNDLLCSWKIPQNQFTREREVTARHLLSHTAGTTVHGFPGYELDGPIPTVGEILDGLPPANTDPVRVDAVPGSLWRYSGGGFTILQLLLVDLLRSSFPVLMHELVLGPLGMLHSTFEQPLPQGLRKQAATGGLASGERLPGGFRVHPEMAAAGLWTTAADLATFAIELQLSALGKSNKVLSRSTSNLMLARHTALPSELIGGFLGSAIGLGVFLDGEGDSRWFGHSGSNAGYESYLIADFCGHGAVILTSSESSALVGEILTAIAREYAWPHFKGTEISVIRV